MAELSDQLLVVAVLGYLAACLGYLTEYVLSRSSAVPAVSAPELVSARAGSAADGPSLSESSASPSAVSSSAASPPPGKPSPPPGLPSPSLASSPGLLAGSGRVAVGLTAVGVAAHAGVLITRGIAAGRVPWGNMYEFVVALSLVAGVAWLVLVARRPALRPLGLFVCGALVVLLGFAGMVLYTRVAPLVPALNSYWLKIHVSAMASASGLFLVGFVPAALFLVKTGYDAGRQRFPYSIGARLPSAPSLERLAFRVNAFAFPIWTFGTICGAIWAEAAWGRYWGWDPKETWSFVTWVAYAAYLHARATPSVKRTTATWFAVAAWGTMLINLYVINFVAVGLHSYAHVS
jgi:cytochrome c-type biogenesis protein CcsB